MDKIKPFEKEFMDFFKQVGCGLGFPEQMLHIIGALYIEPRPIAMDELAKKTGYSLATISNSMRIFREGTIIQRSKKPGTKKVFFYMEKDLAKINLQKINFAMKNLIIPAKQTLPKIMENHKKDLKDKTSKEKMKIIEDYHKQVLKLEKLMDKWKTDLEKI